MSTLERPGFGERYGVAINASSLEDNGALEFLGAAGYARLELEAGAPDERALIEARLAPLLWRARYGRDGIATIGAIHLFRSWLLQYPWISEVERVRDGMALLVSSRLLHEWLTSRCTWCGGTGWQEMRDGMRVRADRGVRNVRLALCITCKGSGRKRTGKHERARAISRADAWHVERREFVFIWLRLFSHALEELHRISGLVAGPLQKAMARDTVPAVVTQY